MDAQLIHPDNAGAGQAARAMALAADLARLKDEHRDLDAAIDALERSVIADQVQIQRLKKRKLVLRDRIAHLRDAITPDIVA